MDLNDLRFFALIVEHGGFSAAERHAHITKSKLSRRVALLEERLGVRLLQRSTRRLALTEAGRAFYEHCQAMVVEAEAAEQAMESLRAEPSGRVRMTCPTAMAQFYLARLVAEFMGRHARVTIELDATDRVVNLIDEGVDLALRTFGTASVEPGLVSRRVATGQMVLVASPAYVARHGGLDDPQALDGHATIGSMRDGSDQTWALVSTDGQTLRVPHRPRLLCSDFTLQYQGALGDVGIALLPLLVAWRGLRDGHLVRLANGWASPEREINLVFASRRGMLPSIRALVDFLVERVPTAMAE
ncbi:MAG: LysR family transcriptional regulator [Rhodocyclaceae bacterium]|nr:LysR family transcriptional regulator [Rhodocyclaceae bacterium]